MHHCILLNVVPVNHDHGITIILPRFVNVLQKNKCEIHWLQLVFITIFGILILYIVQLLSYSFNYT